MLFSDTDIPTALVDAAFSGSLVVFAGAGVSMQAPLRFPSFDKLVDIIKEDVDPANRLRERYSSKGTNEIIYRETPEQYLSYLESKGHNIRKACTAHLSTKGVVCELHSNLVRLFPHSGPVRIVTTNFDDGFEIAATSAGRDYPVYNSPALPLGSDVSGIVHLHGSISNYSSMVLTAEDYGQAYVTIGWSSRFLVDLFKTYTVLFIGYSCGDSLVDYLTRSISSDMSGRAFALCRESADADSWRIRGVEPVSFNNFEDLPMIIGTWASYMEQSVTDRVHELKRLGAIQELSLEQSDYIIHSLQWNDDDDRALFAGEFCDQSNSFNHLELLHERGLTDYLRKSELTRADQTLLAWTISRFSIERYKELQALCFHVQDELSVHFYERLALNLAGKDAPPAAIGPWVAWFEHVPHHYLARCIYPLAQIVSKCDSPDVTLAILRLLLRVSMGVKENPYSGVESGPTIPINDDYFERQVLDGLKRHKETIGGKLFDYCVEQIELAYSIQTDCWTNENVFDSLSFARSSVEPCNQDRFEHGAVSILLDLARESVSQQMAETAADKCLVSRCNLLVRLGLWIKNKFVCDGECLRLIAKRDYLENMYLKHEVFQLVRNSFESASPSQRKEFIEYLEQLYKKKDDSDYECFNMCSWLLSTTDDPELRRMRDTVLTRHPNYQVREHPDFDFYFSSERIDSSTENKISRADFSIDSLLQRLQNTVNQRADFEKLEIVSTPARDYPDLAISMLETLLKKQRTDAETILCKLLLYSIDWNSQSIQRDSVYSLLLLALADYQTCTTGIEVLRRSYLHMDDRTRWTEEEFEHLLLTSGKNIAVLLEAKSAISTGEDADWLSVGINHPAGKYLELISELENISLKNCSSSKTALTLLKEIDILTLPESATAKGLIACFFSRLNTWIASNSEYAQSFLALLADESWAQAPSWQGIASLSTMSKEAWEMTAYYWKVFFGRHILGNDRLHNNLTRLYVWIMTAHVEEKHRGKMLMICGSASDESLHTACMHIDHWLDSLSDKDQVLQWNSWLSQSFEYLATSSEKNKEIVAKFYCRWIRTAPALRPLLSQAIVRDCSDLKNRDMFIHEGTLKDVVGDSSLTAADKATTIAFLLEHQLYFIHENEVRDVASCICLDDLDSNLSTRLQDAYTRCGMSNVSFKRSL